MSNFFHLSFLLKGFVFVLLGCCGAWLFGLVVRLVCMRRHEYVRLGFVPAKTFDPSLELLDEFWTMVHRHVRSVGIGGMCRIQLVVDQEGLLCFEMVLPKPAAEAIKTSSWSRDIEIFPLTDEVIDEENAIWNDLEQVRAEVRLARRDCFPLRVLGVDRDPLTVFANAFGQMDVERGERIEVTFDIRPAGWFILKRKAFQTNNHLSTVEHGETKLGSAFDAVLPGDQSHGSRTRYRRLSVSDRDQIAGIREKKHWKDPRFVVQILVRTGAQSKKRAKQLIPGLFAGFDQFATPNQHFRARGYGRYGTFFGADFPLYRQLFDLRLNNMLVYPPSCQTVALREVAGLLKPPSKVCSAKNISQCEVILPHPPKDFPVFHGQKDLLPLGVAIVDGKNLPVGMNLQEFFFGYYAGRARYGKTELALAQIIHLARNNNGCFFMDPHRDGYQRALPYLSERVQNGELVELSFAPAREGRVLDERHPGWNLLSMQNRGLKDIPMRSDAIVDAFSSAAGWGQTAARSAAILKNAVQTLLHLALRVPAESAPTIYTIERLLTDPEWRQAAITFVPPTIQRFWTTTFQSYPGGGTSAAAPVCQLISRLSNHRTRAILGSPISTYDARSAMDYKHVILACHGGDTLIASLIVSDLLTSALGRVDIPPHQRAAFYIFLDELQSYDKLSSGRVARFCEECGKYGARVIGMNQAPSRLSEATLETFATNGSILATAANSADGAKFFERQWASRGIDSAALIPTFEKYNYLVQPTHNGKRVDPFHVRGLSVEDWYGKPSQTRPIDIDHQAGNTTVGDTLANLEEHDDNIIRALKTARKNTLTKEGEGVHGEGITV